MPTTDTTNPVAELRAKLNGILGALLGQGNELVDEMHRAIEFLDENLIGDFPPLERWTVHALVPDDVLLVGNLGDARHMPEVLERIREIYPKRRVICFAADIDVQTWREAEAAEVSTESSRGGES